MASDGAGPSIGNYKGVMLCNRPFAGVTAAAKAGAGGESSISFKTGIPSGILGLNPTKRLQPRSKRKKQASAISKHKRWLLSLQQQKRELETALEAEEQAKALKHAKFVAREETMRKEIKQARKGRERVEYGVLQPPQMTASDALDAELGLFTTAAVPSPTEQPEIDEEMDADFFMEEDSTELETKLSEVQQAIVGKRNKPAWAYTEGGREDEEAQAEEEEVDELLEFAKSLDFERFAEDFEVRSALEKLKQRIETLSPRARAVDEERAKLALGMVLQSKEFDTESVMVDAGKKVLRALTQENLEAWTDGEGAPVEGQLQVGDDALSVGSRRSILDDVKSLGQIHSAKSISAVKKQIQKQRCLPLLEGVAEEEEEEQGLELPG